MEKNNTVREYDPTTGSPLTAEDIDYLWDKETTEHILNMLTIYNKAAGGHTTNALEAHYWKRDSLLIENNERPITIDYVAETDFPGYYIYYIRSAQTINRKVRTDKKGKVFFLSEVSAKHAVDTNIVPIDEYFETIKTALIGAVPEKRNERFRFCACSAAGIPFTVHLECKNSTWHFLTAYPTLKEKEITLEKGM